MAVRLIFADEVLEDLDDTYGWYDERRSGLGDEFLNCVDACIETICRTPEGHGRVFKEYRRGLLRRFPYAVFYEYAEGTVTVYCLCHTSRREETWRHRLP